MSQDSAYGSQSQEYAIDTADWYQITVQSNNQLCQYRIRCTASGYFQWMPVSPNNAKPTAAAPVGPVVGTPAFNCKGMTTGQTEIFTIPDNAWFRASTGATFEISCGEGV